MMETLPQMLAAVTAENPGRIAIVEDETALSFGELNHRISLSPDNFSGWESGVEIGSPCFLRTDYILSSATLLLPSWEQSSFH